MTGRSLLKPFYFLSFFLMIMVSNHGATFAQQAVSPPVPGIVATPKTAAQTASPEAIRAEEFTQRIRAEERRISLDDTGTQWIPWSMVAQTTRDFVAEREPNLKTLIGNGQHVDIIANDFDNNGEPDIALFFWGGCGNRGCLYKIYFDRKIKPAVGYFGKELVPYKKGIMLDHAYFSL